MLTPDEIQLVKEFRQECRKPSRDFLIWSADELTRGINESHPYAPELTLIRLVKAACRLYSAAGLFQHARACQLALS